MSFKIIYKFNGFKEIQINNNVFNINIASDWKSQVMKISISNFNFFKLKFKEFGNLKIFLICIPKSEKKHVEIFNKSIALLKERLYYEIIFY